MNEFKNIPIMNKAIEFPECWEEVKPAEFKHLLKLREKLMLYKGVTLLDIKRDWVRFTLKKRGVPFENTHRYYCLVNDLVNSLGWMWRVNEDSSISLNFDSTYNLIPAWHNLVGPASHGADLTFGEFRNALMMINTFNQSKDMQHLDMLVGMLYRPMVKKEREAFDPKKFPLYMARVKYMPHFLKWGVYAWYVYLCQYLMTGDFIVGGHQVNFSELFSASGDDNAEPSLGLDSVLFSVAESGVFGNIDQVDNTQLMRVLLKLLDDSRKAKQLERELNKHKS